MIIQLKSDPKPPVDEREWHMVWCLVPRVIERHWVWLSRVERRLHKMTEHYDGYAPWTTKEYEYRLIEWYYGG